MNRPEYRAITFDELRISYKLQVEALLDGGVDLLLVETIFDTLNAKGSLVRYRRGERRTQHRHSDHGLGNHYRRFWAHLSGQTVEAFLTSISHIPYSVSGFNCALGADQFRPYLQRLSTKLIFIPRHIPMQDCQMLLENMKKLQKK